jgi:hypothetical protein
MRHEQINLYAVKAGVSDSCSLISLYKAFLTVSSYIGYPVQRPLAHLRVMLSRWIIAYYGLIRDSRSSLWLIFFEQRVFALRPRMGWLRELPQFNPRFYSFVPPSVPRRFERLLMTVPSPSALAFAISALARLTQYHHRRFSDESVTRLQSSLHAAARRIARPSSARTFTFELSTPELPHGVVEYNYTGKQSIPVAGLTPARNAALWAANRLHG